MRSRITRSDTKAIIALGVDVGTNKTGIALYKNGVIYPLTAITGKHILPAIVETIYDHEVNVVVLGVPSYGDMRAKILRLYKDLIKRCPKIGVILVKEDNTSKIARAEILSEQITVGAVNKSKLIKQAKNRGVLDAYAAILILKMGLDKLGVEYKV